MTTTRQLTPGDKTFVDTLVRVGLMLLVLGEATAGRTESDIWGHLSIGLDMLRTGQFLWVDPYSFTHDQLWVNHEWLWDLGTAALYNGAGLPGLLAFRAVLIGLVLWSVERATRRAPGWVRLLTLAAVALACIGQWRSTPPQIVTLALYASLLAAIGADQRPTTIDQRLTTNDQRPLPLWLPLLFALWANLHGGWIFGLGALGSYAVMHPRRRTLLIATASAVATLLNPYGPRLWLAIAEAMQRGWSDLSEWQPVWRIAAGPDAVVLWLALAAGTVALWRHARHDLWRWGWTIVALAAAANSRRLAALAGISLAMLLVPAWRADASAVAPAWTPARRGVFAGVVAAGLAWCLISIGPTLTCFPPLPQWRAPESDAVAFLTTTTVRRIVPHFDYGEYAIFHLRDRLQVAIDNRRETVYSEAAVQENQRFADGLDFAYPDRIGADAVWWPASDHVVIDGLEQRGWVRRFEGPRTVVLMKTAGPLVRGQAADGTPCFPNP